MAAAGPIARIMDTSSWPIPFVAPKDARLGEAAEMYMKIQPVKARSLVVPLLVDIKTYHSTNSNQENIRSEEPQQNTRPGQDRKHVL